MSLSLQPSPFEPGRLYRTNHPALKSLASVKTMAMWRCDLKGPSFIRSGSRILYRGHDLNRAIQPHLQSPDTQPPPAFEPGRLYRSNDADLAILATMRTLASWRYKKFGPKFMRYGPRVVYYGSDLNEFIDQSTVHTNVHFHRRPDYQPQLSPPATRQ